MLHLQFEYLTEPQETHHFHLKKKVWVPQRISLSLEVRILKKYGQSKIAVEIAFTELNKQEMDKIINFRQHTLSKHLASTDIT